MVETIEAMSNELKGDLVLREVWKAKATLSGACGHNLDRLFAEARERQRRSGRQVVNLQAPNGTTQAAAVKV